MRTFLLLLFGMGAGVAFGLALCLAFDPHYAEEFYLSVNMGLGSASIALFASQPQQVRNST